MQPGGILKTFIHFAFAWVEDILSAKEEVASFQVLKGLGNSVVSY